MALSLNLQLGLSPRQTIDPDVVAFQQRVIADGGTVEDINFLNAFVNNAKQNNYYSDIVATYSPSWGVKGTTTASKLYSLAGVGQDLAQTTGASQPTISVADLSGKTRLLFDGADDMFDPKAFAMTQPETVALGGYRSASHTNNDRIFDGFTSNLMLMRQGFSANSMQILLGSGIVNDVGVVVGSDYHLLGLYNGASSYLRHDDAVKVTGDIGAGNSDGFTLGATPTGTLHGNFKVGMVVILDAAVDAGYDAKMTALYNFSKSAYGTA